MYRYSPDTFPGPTKLYYRTETPNPIPNPNPNPNPSPNPNLSCSSLFFLFFNLCEK